MSPTSSVKLTADLEDAPQDVEPVSQPTVEAPHPVTEKPVPPQIPNGGLIAWLQVVASFCMFFSTWGFVQTYGSFQAFYQNDLLSNHSVSEISWIGSIQGFLLILGGLISGPLFDRGYHREVVIVGTILIPFGMMMTSISTRYYEVFLAQGVCVGIGCACLYTPSVAVVSTYFSTKRAIASGLASAGGGIGGIIFPIVFHYLQPKIGFPWATRVIGFIALFMLIIHLLLLRPRPKSIKHVPVSRSDFNAPYVLIIVFFFLSLVGLFIPIFHLPAYGNSVLHLKSSISFALIPILNVGSTFGRIGSGYVADKLKDSVAVAGFSLFCCAIMGFAWISVSSEAGIIVFSLFYGFLAGMWISIPGPVVVSVIKNMGTLGTLIGIAFGVASFGLLIGNPIGGALVKDASSSYTHLQIFTGATLMGAALAAFAAWYIQKRKS